MSSDSRAIIQKIQNLEQQVSAYQARTSHLTKKIDLTKGENALLNVSCRSKLEHPRHHQRLPLHRGQHAEHR